VLNGLGRDWEKYSHLEATLAGEREMQEGKKWFILTDKSLLWVVRDDDQQLLVRTPWEGGNRDAVSNSDAMP